MPQSTMSTTHVIAKQIYPEESDFNIVWLRYAPTGFWNKFPLPLNLQFLDVTSISISLYVFQSVKQLKIWNEN